MEIPEYVIEKLKLIAKRNEIELDEIKKEYEEKYFNANFIQKDPQFSDNDTRHKYASGLMWSDYVSKPKVEPTDIIPIGVSPIKKSKTNAIPYCSAFALNNKQKLIKISFNGNIAFKTKEISYWNLYKDVKLQHFKESNDYKADNRTEFESPKPLGDDMDKKTIIDKLKIPIIIPEEAKDSLSKKDSSGYTDQTDWRCIRGFIKYESQTEYEEGEYGEWGRYTIAGGGGQMVSDDGTVNPSGFSLSVSPTLMNYPVDSECYFLGTIRSYESKKTNETMYTMDCYCIIPIIIVRE